MAVRPLACFDRIKEFCNYRQNATSEGTTQRPSFSLVNHIVSWQGQSCGWHRDETILHGLAIGIQLGAVTAVVGPVGSGKSSFLSAILGNLICTSRMAEPVAEEEYERDETAYCSRTSLLENGIVRQHILGNPSSKRKRYDTVVSVCALEADLQGLEKGHFTLVGSQVVKASGGQKQCIALARAVYSRRNVVVLDDIFSEIDAVTARHVSNRLLGPNRLLKKQRTSVVVAPHRRMSTGRCLRTQGLPLHPGPRFPPEAEADPCFPQLPFPLPGEDGQWGAPQPATSVIQIQRDPGPSGPDFYQARIQRRGRDGDRGLCWEAASARVVAVGRRTQVFQRSSVVQRQDVTRPGLAADDGLERGQTELGGVGVSTLALAELRSRINVVSQDPFLNPGAVRVNTDPFGACSGDAHITRALERVGLWGLVRGQGGLDGSSWTPATRLL
ncbi:putative ABC transporter [Colletotrichum sublineola]|uniref:Putative ABC transporter n=1 Tax=Colletotrichum sublineola TaxID=1173701 RepID=A0A066XRX1_COLSU|nr:putative ABC transporter [Colletotrichum sublineola]